MDIACINAISFSSQIVQIGAIGTLLALVLHGRGMKATLIGAVTVAPWLAVFLFGRYVPALIHKYGFIFSNLVAIFITAASLVGLGCVANFYLIFILSFIVGCGLIIRWVACDTWIIKTAKSSNSGRAIAVHETLMGAGIACGPLLIAVTGIQGAFPFIVCALVVTSGLIPLYCIHSFGSKISESGNISYQKKSILAIICAVPIAISGAVICGLIETSAISFLSIYSLSFGFSLQKATLFTTCFGTGATLLQVPIGWLADKRTFKTAQKVCASGTIITAIVLMSFLSLPFVPWISVFIMGGCVSGMNTLAVMEAGKSIDDFNSSAALALIAMGYTAGSLIGPILTGLMTDFMSKQGLMILAISSSIPFFAGVYFSKLFSQSKPGKKLLA